MTKNVKFLIAFLVSVVLVQCFLVVLFFLLFLKATGEKCIYDDENKGDTPTENVSSFDECVAAGYPVMESYPRRCAVPDGQTFVEEIEDIEDDTAKLIDLKVYFSKDPSSSDNPGISVSVNRQTERTDIATYAIEQLIAGPTSTEQVNGLYTPVKLTGVSNCNGKDFLLSIDKNNKIATLKFCKVITSGGIGDDARIKTTIENTLEQFSTVDEVTILTKDNHCFGDESGMDLCLNVED